MKKQTSVVIRISPEARKKLKVAAAKKGMSLTAYVDYVVSSKSA